MPNYKVFQDNPSELKIKVYGNDSGTDRALTVDASGNLVVTDGGGSLTVDATSLDIRALTQASDSILSYGKDGEGTNRAMLTDTTGRLLSVLNREFTELTQTVDTADAYTGATSRTVGDLQEYSFWVQNTGVTNTADVKLQISPDSTTWLDDTSAVTVATSSSAVVVPTRFMKYARISYKSTTAAAATSLTITLNGRS